MFARRTVEIKVVKTPKQDTNAPQMERRRMHPVEILAISRVYVKDAAILAGVGYGLKTLLDTSSEIAIIAAKAKIK